ncbi:Lysosomal Pro-X carboxypeptidase [Linum grandiflorum]
MQHRYYGESIPFGSWKEASANASSLGYLNSAQAIADYAAVILHVKQTYSAKNSPVIVIGGSYSGMLASWFRLKYPHIAVGALASSAPILYFDGGVAPEDGYYSIVTKDFKDYLDSIYADAAQYNEPPEYPVEIVCRAIDSADKSDLLGQILAAVVAYTGNNSCNDVLGFSTPSASSRAWRWQVCSELVFQIGHDSNTMFPPEPFSLNSFIKNCKTTFGVLPQPHWVTTFYGGHDLKLALHRFASNIIFSNGLKDPYSSGG